MSEHPDYVEALSRAERHAHRWLASVSDRPVGPRQGATEVQASFDGPIPEFGCSAADVVDELALGAEPGLMAMGSGRFFGWVIGGTLPAGLAADWLVSAWDQNAALRFATPAVAAIEQVAAQWLLELLHLPDASDVGFVTGGTMANFTCLGAARGAVLAQAGWDVHVDGLTGGPRVHVLVGAERHETVDLALRYLGLGRPTVVPSDLEGRIRTDSLSEALDLIPATDPVIVCLQAGNLHSGAFDPFGDAIELAHRRGAWVHVDGAFGLWAAASPTLQHLAAGIEKADSWSTDAHKTLNVPYDCGIAIVRHPAAMRASFELHTSYLISDHSGPGDPHDKVPQLSRRARGVPVWAVLRSLGRSGVSELVGGLAARARQITELVGDLDGFEVLNDVVYTQVCIAAMDDETTRAVASHLMASGMAWISGSQWRGRAILRISVSNWSTSEEDVRLAAGALRHAWEATMAPGTPRAPVAH